VSPKVLAARLARAVLALVHAPLRLLPRRDKVVMISRQSDTVPADFARVAARLAERAPGLETVVLARMLRPGLRGGLSYVPHVLRQMWHVATARVVLLDTYSIVVSALGRSPGLTVVQMWHALGALKKFGYSTLDLPGGRTSEIAGAMRMHAGYDVVLVSAPAARAGFADAFRVPLERVVVAPLPRVDALRDPARRARTRQHLLSRFPELGGGRVVLYAPTLDRRAADPGYVPAVSLTALAATLEAAGFVPVIKPHPVSEERLPAHLDRYRDVSTSALLAVADAFVTDCSSAVFEAGVAGVPVYFLLPEGVADPQELYLDLRAEVPGAVADDPAHLVEILRSPDAAAVREGEAFVQRYVAVPQTGSATDGVVDVLLGALRGELPDGRVPRLC